MTNEQLLAKRNAELEKELTAQNRELEIEAALEKVRSRSLAMHKSDELKEVVNIVSDKMNDLGVVIDGSVTIKIISEGSKDFIHWSAAPHLLSSATRYEVPYFDHPIFTDFWAAKENGLDFFAKAYPFEIKNTFFEYLFEHSDYRNIPDEVKKLVLQNDSYAWSIAFYKHSGIYIDSISGKLLSEQGIQILKRFARVFEQAYIRFLDLQRAESQARESQIQLALERARTQSMIMQHSTELDDTLRVFHEQVLQLGIPSAFSFLWLPDEEKDRHIFWAAWAENNSTVFKSKAINYPLDRNEPATAQCLIDWKSNEPVVAYHVPPPSVKGYFAAWSELIAGVEELKPENFSDGLYYVEAFMKYGCFGVMVKNILPEDEKKILGRFAVEFERAYTRFLDLQKAEAQAREAQIELALERVRARTMAMQKSDELKDAAALLFQQVKTLGVPAYSCGFNIWQENEKTFTSWMSIQDGSDFNAIQNIPLTEDANFIHYVKSKQEGEQFFVLELRGERMQEHYRYLKTVPAFKAGFDYAESVGFDLPKTQIHYVANFSQGNLLFITLEPCPEFHDIFKRFAAVFEQTYTRFLDLQKAEAHAREAQIELALERVRGRTMAMHKSEELIEIMAVMFEQLAQLQLRTDAITLSLEYKTKLLNLWMAIPGQTYPAELKIPYINIPFVNSAMKAVGSGDDFYSITCGLEEKNRWVHHLFEHTIVKNTPDDRKQFLLQAPGLALSMAMGKKIALLVANYAAIPFSAEENEIIKRFVNVFEQSYIRFRDLQKAEDQAREAQIELSLERVRAKTMAMHNSADVGETAAVMVEELKKLGIETIRCGIGIMHEPGDMEVWTISTDENNKTDIIIGWLDMNMHPLLHGAFESWRNKIESYSYELKDEDLLSYYNAINNYPGYPIRYDTKDLPRLIHHNEFHFAEGTLFAFSLEQLSEEQRKIFKRFAGVFGQTYRRYLDLKTAEAQAREARIEAALERVRSKAMMMQKSEDLSGAVAIVFDELNKLNIGLVRCGIGILHKNKRTADVFTTTISDDNSTIQVSGDESMDIHPLLHNAFEAWLQQQDYEYELKGEDLNRYYIALTHVNFTLPLSQSLVSTNENACQYYYNATFVFGGLFAFSDAPISDNTRKIMKRFANVFEQTYTRFLDIKKAEAQAKEAQIEAALERVRSRTLAMQKSDELTEVSVVLFRQLISLGIEPNRLYISIMKDDEGETEFWITDEDGSKVSSAYTDNLNVNASFKKMYDGWKTGRQSLIIDMQGKELEEYFQHLTSLGISFKDALKQKRRIQHLAYFNRGFIGMAAPDDQPAETIHLLERFAAAFNLTFTRFNDLKIAEAHALQAEQDLTEIKSARQKAEDALTELQATQKQLIQSEKMASLGELTAGIAHEIQNPLNFVNNFSEVNQEMIDELQNELKSGNIEEAIAISNDIKDNEEKIKHHGKRADAIVKGMLQHSRKSEGAKEPTDINALCDEYLRLSYHGLRAKDKSFNADFKTDFDESLSADEAGIGKINIVPQNIGRVLLNLFNNAFYAVKEKLTTHRSSLTVDYKPLVSVKTKKLNDRIEIVVSDNGNGIPQNIVDKIFQPFFTTKPSGQGTGLGLSLSYDIIKAHGGEIKVETKPEEGTTFIIHLPVV